MSLSSRSTITEASGLAKTQPRPPFLTGLQLALMRDAGTTGAPLFSETAKRAARQIQALRLGLINWAPRPPRLVLNADGRAELERRDALIVNDVVKDAVAEIEGGAR